MKNDGQNEQEASAQSRKDNSNLAGNYRKLANNRQLRMLINPALRKAYATATSGAGERLQTQNLAKAPPGRARDPGIPRGHPPESAADPPYFPPLSQRDGQGVSRPPNRTELKSENKGINNNTKKMKHYKHLNFSTMKKQILFLMVFVLAAFAGMKSYGQATHDSNPQPISCTDDALHPIAGKSYDYTAASNQSGNFTFWATKDQSFITTTAGTTTNNLSTRLTTPAGLIATSTNYGVADPAATVSITWSDATLNGTDPASSPTFVAVLKDGTCTNNFEAWSIEPIKAFTVDIQNLKNTDKTALGYGTGDSQCFDVVRNATYSTGNIHYDFGTQVLYYEVVAANFTGSYTPTFELTGLTGAQTATIEWAYDKAFTSPVTVISGAASGTAVTTNATSTTTGVSIYVRVTISNLTYEGLASETVRLAVDGQNSVGDWDIVNSTCAETTGADQADYAEQILNPRPTLDATTPSPFAPGDDSDN